LNCGGNGLTSLDVSMLSALTGLYCAGNGLTSLDVSMLTALTSLGCSYNPGDGVSTFPVTAWFDNNSIPSGVAPPGSFYSVYYFTTGSWDYNGTTIAVDYQMVN
jgi:hypothetical protein